MSLSTLRSNKKSNGFSVEFGAFRGMVAQPLPPQSELATLWQRYDVEAAWLTAQGIEPDLARAAAARAAAQFFAFELNGLSDAGQDALPVWLKPMAADISPEVDRLIEWFGVSRPGAQRLKDVWSLLGTADELMETGGDIRLARDPQTGLNGYGCSHRPRPWAITFASSTASSSSERGYVAADKARLTTTSSLLRGVSRHRAVLSCIGTARHAIVRMFGLQKGEDVIFAASGTDTELLALALTHLSGQAAPILNILIAPEETGRGVPMAARGLHFAVDTAMGHDVAYETPIEGFRPDTTLANIPLRLASGVVRSMVDVEADIETVLVQALAAGKRVILHGLDLSKTGLLAPSPAFLGKLRGKYGAAFDIVLDACQARLSPASIRAYLDVDAVVLVTGSKFFTGPPFAGAALLPRVVAERLQAGQLPAGLAAYFSRGEFPPGSPAGKSLPEGGNYGLALRWHAALGEMRSFARVSAAQRSAILKEFAATVAQAIEATPGLALLPAPPLYRGEYEQYWERLPSIFTFSLRAPHAPKRCLTPAEARQVYVWLNTDLSAWFPAQADIAGRICHIGQPVPLPQPQGEGQMGALRVSAGARLFSGEPSHRALPKQARLAREFADVGVVFAKIALILKAWDEVSVDNPSPSYRSLRAPERIEQS